MAETKLINRPNSANSPPPNCAICLGSFSNKCFSDSCMHQFCFKCLLEWSKIKAECPLCKQPFKRIIHNVKSNEEYDEHVVDIPPNEQIHIIDNEEIFFLPLGGTPQPPTRHHFHFRTTFTVDTRGEHAIQQMLLTHPLTNGGQISIDGYPTRNIYRRRTRENYTTTSFRRSIYRRNLWVNALADVTGRYREVAPAFFRDCPGARTRLVPWLNRELNALLYENTQLVMHLVDIIMDLLLRHHICSRTFRNLLFEYLDNKTDHFIHEFYNFMRSPFDMIGYDRYVTYSERPRSPPYVVTLPDELSDSNDSDVIIVGATNPQEPVVIDLVNDDTDSDEPILVQADENVPHIPMLPITQTITIPEDNTTDRCSRSRSPSPPMITLQETPRPTALPPKLRFKVGASSCCRNGGETSSRGDYHHHGRSTARSKRKRKAKAWPSRNGKRRQRSRSSSSSSTSSSTSAYSSSSPSSEETPRETHKRYKEKRRLLNFLLKAKRPRSPASSDSDVFIEKASSSDSDVPLASLKGRRKQMKKMEKASNHVNINNGTKISRRENNRSKHGRGGSASGGGGSTSSTAPVSTVTSSDYAKDFSTMDYWTVPRMPSVASTPITSNSNLPGCSRYSTNSTNDCSDSLADVNGTPLDLVIGNRHRDFSSGSNLVPSCSNYQPHSLYSSTSSDVKMNDSRDPVLIKFDNSSADEDCPLKDLLKKEIKDEPPSNHKSHQSSSSTSMNMGLSSSPPPQKLCRSNGRLRNIFIKKEESTNMWYSYPRNYDSDSSSN